MRTTRIYIDQPLAVGDEIELPPQAAEHLVRVLRLVAGDAVTLFNGDGLDFAAVLIKTDKREVLARLDSNQPAVGESPLPLTLAQGVARGEKMDLIIQKATELGVTRIVPLLTERTEVRLDAERAVKRLAHWRAVIHSACEQSGRGRVPLIDAPLPLQIWLDHEAAQPFCRVALLPESHTTLRHLSIPSAGAVLVVGPEGGLGERDVTSLSAAGFKGLRLGPRILRTETAGIAAIAALQAWHGDF